MQVLLASPSAYTHASRLICDTQQRQCIFRHLNVSSTELVCVCSQLARVCQQQLQDGTAHAIWIVIIPTCLHRVLLCFAGRLKEQGNAAFRAGQLKFARAKYTKALRLADRIFDIETDVQVINLQHAEHCGLI